MKFTIPITPTAQERPDSRAYKGKDGKWRAMTYTSKTQRDNAEAINTLLKKERPDVPIQGPVLLGVRAYMAIPQSVPKSWKKHFKGRGARERFRELVRTGVIRPITTPDMDNYLKQIQDCLTSCEFWGDDCQVVGYLPGTGKYYTTDRSRWEIEIVPYDWRRGLPLLQRALPILEEVW